jgi:hypothetical protein
MNNFNRAYGSFVITELVNSFISKKCNQAEYILKQYELLKHISQ